MFTMDVPYVPPHETPVVVLAQAADTLLQSEYQLIGCDEVPSAGGLSRQ
jgi:hypothetical protein